MKLLKHLALFSLAACCYAQVPTISNITVNAVDHASVNIQYRSNTSSFVQLKYGLSSGTYIYTSASYQISANGSDGGNFDASLSLGGLAPSTTYFLLPTARPNANNDTNICQVSGCGAVEQSFTTSALPSPHPALPTPPNAWVPVHPDTSAYIVVSLIPNGSTGECVAQSNVSAQTGWSAAIVAGDSIQTIINKIYYGTVLEISQGTQCKVFPTETSFNTGIVIPNKGIDTACTSGSIDSNTCRWIMVRTHQVNASDFPAFGFRTGAAWASKLASLIAQTPNNRADNSSPGRGVQNFNGQLFDCYQSGCNHFWVENIEFTHATGTGVIPTGTVDPNAFGPYARWIGNGTDVTTPSTTPDYMVLDRIYSPSQPYPSREFALFSPGGNHWAILSSYATANFWVQGVYPRVDPSFSGLTITIPKSFYQYNAFDSTPIGMSGSASLVFSGANVGTYTGSFWGWLNSSGLTVDYQTASGVTGTCTGCTAINEGSPSRNSVPSTAMYFFNGSCNGAGSCSLVGSTPDNVNPSALSPFRPIGIYHYPGNLGVFDNNFITAIGQTIYNDTDGPRQDDTWTHNYLYFPRSKMQSNSAWDGYGYSFRNDMETKQALRWSIAGNFFDGSAAYQNAGNAMYVAGSYAAPYSTGTQDIAIQNNTFKHLASGFQCAGGGVAAPPDSPTAARILIGNNLWIDLNRDVYNNGGGGLFSGPFDISPGCEDVSIVQNTVGLTQGPGPALLLMGASNGGTTVQGEGLNFSNNILTFSLNSLDVFWSQCGDITPSHPANPGNVCSGGSTGTTFTQMFASSFIHAGSSITSSWNLTGNILIGALTERSASVWTDITQSQINTISSTFPSGSPANVFVPGATLAARQQAANWDSTTFRANWSTYNQGTAGANIDTINSTSGVVTDISIQSLSAGPTIYYKAPDTRACSIDTSPDGVTWTRTTDAGGSTSRTKVLNGVTGTYQYRIMCYADQQTAFDYLPNQVTSGTATYVAPLLCPNP